MTAVGLGGWQFILGSKLAFWINVMECVLSMVSQQNERLKEWENKWRNDRMKMCFMLFHMCFFFYLQRRNGDDIPVAETKTISNRRFAASFRLKEVTNQDQDLYRCVTQSERGSGVSNFAGLIVRGGFTASQCSVTIAVLRQINIITIILLIYLFI